VNSPETLTMGWAPGAAADDGPVAEAPASSTPAAVAMTIRAAEATTIKGRRIRATLSRLDIC
jgi:hypothetical protein